MSGRSIEGGEFAATRRPLPRASALPPRCYTDPNFYGHEVERIFRREWLSVGRVEQVAQAGDYFTVDLLDEPLGVVRDRNNAIHVMCFPSIFSP